MEINLALVKKLIADQFPQWADLSIKQVIPGGHDNRTFRLGNEMSIRLPSAEYYAAKIEIEQRWLPFLSGQLSIQIPVPIAMGKVSNSYPWNWSIYKWLAGESANNLKAVELDLNVLAKQLAAFLQELRTIDTTGAPIGGPQADMATYDNSVQKALKNLTDDINTLSATKVWEKALSSHWAHKPVWIHGDLTSTNILIKDKKLAAVIDFGGMGIGDPSCDLVISWTLLDEESRRAFKSNLNLDSNTWARARGWALWKALITLAELKDKTCPEAIKQKQIIEDIISEHEIEHFSCEFF